MPAIHESAAETLRVVDRGQFETASERIEFAAYRASAIAHTRLFRPEQLAALAQPAPGFAGRLTVLDATTQEAAATWAPERLCCEYWRSPARDPVPPTEGSVPSACTARTARNQSIHGSTEAEQRRTWSILGEALLRRKQPVNLRRHKLHP